MKSEDEWKKELTPKEYAVLREGKTEVPFSGNLLKNKKEGTYQCVACGNKLFKSNTKFESGTGWPSFYDVVPGSVEFKKELFGTEVRCAKCGSHLGHVFNDGPEPTGKRYCINSVTLDFKEKKKE